MPRLGEHRSLVLQQHRAGHILMSGPTPDRSLGIMVFRAASQADLEAILRSEPWIAAGEPSRSSPGTSMSCSVWI
jgi:uncharacterized protein YciI